METTTVSKYRWQKPYKIILILQMFADIAVLVVSLWLAVYIKNFMQTLNVPWGFLRTKDETYKFIVSVPCFNGTTSCMYFSGGYIAYLFVTLIFFFSTAAGILGTSILLNGFFCGVAQNETILWKQLKYWRRINFVNLIRDIFLGFVSSFYNVIYSSAFLVMILFRGIVLLVGFVYTTSVKVQIELNFDNEITD